MLQESEPAEAENKKPSGEPSTPQTAVVKMCNLTDIVGVPKGTCKVSLYCGQSRVDLARMGPAAGVGALGSPDKVFWITQCKVIEPILLSLSRSVTGHAAATSVMVQDA